MVRPNDLLDECFERFLTAVAAAASAKQLFSTAKESVRTAQCVIEDLLPVEFSKKLDNGGKVYVRRRGQIFELSRTEGHMNIAIAPEINLEL